MSTWEPCLDNLPGLPSLEAELGITVKAGGSDFSDDDWEEEYEVSPTSFSLPLLECCLGSLETLEVTGGAEDAMDSLAGGRFLMYSLV